jgi:hypothetical protein
MKIAKESLLFLGAILGAVIFSIVFVFLATAIILGVYKLLGVPFP